MSVDVYLVSRIEWRPMMMGKVVVPSPAFKIGFSENPFERVDQLRTASPHNLALWGVVLCSSVETARRTERVCHGLLERFRGRGEWFVHDVPTAWGTIARGFPSSALWLTDWYDVDLDTMRLRPPPKGAWHGCADNYHDYRSYKADGALDGRFAALAA